MIFPQFSSLVFLESMLMQDVPGYEVGLVAKSTHHILASVMRSLRNFEK